MLTAHTILGPWALLLTTVTLTINTAFDCHGPQILTLLVFEWQEWCHHPRKYGSACAIHVILWVSLRVLIRPVRIHLSLVPPVFMQIFPPFFLLATNVSCRQHILVWGMHECFQTLWRSISMFILTNVHPPSLHWCLPREWELSSLWLGKPS